jgi:DNA-directed RNA polymerase specialized sigma24 family protein
VISTALVLPPGVVRAIRCEAFRAWRSLRWFGFDPSDVRQELVLHLLGRSAHYDASRSSLPTFASRLCRHRTAQLIEAAASEKRGGGAAPRSLSEPVRLGERRGIAIMAELGDTISDDQYAMGTTGRSQTTAESLALRLDVDRVLSHLPAKLANVANVLASGMPAVEAAQHLQISRATLYRRIGQLRCAFREAGLHGYVVLKEAA